jgi:hypothetical protein
MRVRIIREPHPLGFSKYGVQCGRVTLVLHAWGPGSSDVDIHDHRFSFWSLVLRGAMTERTWKAVPGSTHQVLSWQGPGRLADTGTRCGIRQADCVTRGAGSLYRRRAPELHAITVERAPLLTLLVKAYPRQAIPAATVIRPAPAADEAKA